MDKRRFLKTAFLSGATILAAPLELFSQNVTPINKKRKKWKHWVWINPNPNDTDDDIKKLYASYYKAGIRGIFFEADSERHFRLAKKEKIEAHRWMWTINRGEKELLNFHPEWYAKNRNGESCADKPPYVDYYRWLCPSKDEVKKYLEQQAKSILEKDYVDGIHLDYVRYCDVVLAVNLWDKYGIDQSMELPQYDYCYCDECCNEFKNLTGRNPLEEKHPDQDLSWRKFRYDRITTIVNNLSSIAHEYKKPISAAVFPTPEVAKRLVRQDWVNWNLDAVCPMIYHGFYNENVSWIGDAVTEGVKSLHNNFPLFAGLYLPDFKSDDEIKQGIQYAQRNGAKGISFFGKVDDTILRILKSAWAD